MDTQTQPQEPNQPFTSANIWTTGGKSIVAWRSLGGKVTVTGSKITVNCLGQVWDFDGRAPETKIDYCGPIMSIKQGNMAAHLMNPKASELAGMLKSQGVSVANGWSTTSGTIAILLLAILLGFGSFALNILWKLASVLLLIMFH